MAFSLLLKNRNFLPFFLGQLVSRLGNAISTLGLVWMVHLLSNSTLQMSLVLAASVIARVLLAPFSGVLVERWHKRSVMMVTDAFRGLFLLSLSVLAFTHAASVWLLVLFSFALATAGTLFTPSYIVLQKTMVGQEQLLQANTLQQTSLNITQIAGPAIAGLLIGLFGLGTAFTVDAATFFVSVLTLFFVKVHEPQPNKRPLTGLSIVRDVVDGAKTAIEFPQFRILTPFMLLYNFFIIAVENLLIVQFVANVLHRGATTVGFINTCMAVGELTGSLLLTLVTKKWGKDKLLVVNMIVTALCISGVGFSRSAIVIGVLFFIGGFCMSIVNVAFFTSIQEAIPGELLGRVYGMLSSVFEGAIPLAQLLFGAIAVVLPVGNLISVLGLLAAVSGAGAFLNPSLRRRPTDSEPASAKGL